MAVVRIPGAAQAQRLYQLPGRQLKTTSMTLLMVNVKLPLGGAGREGFLRGGDRVRREDLFDVNNLQDVCSRPRPPQIQLERKTISIQIFVLP